MCSSLTTPALLLEAIEAQIAVQHEALKAGDNVELDNIQSLVHQLTEVMALTQQPEILPQIERAVTGVTAICQELERQRHNVALQLKQLNVQKKAQNAYLSTFITTKPRT